MKLAIISMKGTSSEMMARAASKYFDTVSSFDLKNIRVDVNKDKTAVMHEDKDLTGYDCVYVRGSFKYVDLITSIAISLKNKVYMPITSESFLIAHNKFLTEVKLKEEGIPFPSTHLVYKPEMAKVIAENFKYPVVFKTLSGTHGKGVMFAESIESANSLIDMLSKLKEPYMIQEFIETDASDIRALVVGREVIAMKRTAKKGELRAGVHSGGEGEKIELSYDEKQLARKSARALDLDICAVDILKGPIRTVVTEVNLSPGIVGLTKATKLDIADRVASYLFVKASEFKKAKEEGREINSFSTDQVLTKGKEMLTKLVVKAGRIILPASLTEIMDFDHDEEVKLKVEDDGIALKKVKKIKVKQR